MHNELNNKIIVGLTGQSGAGKSNVAQAFKYRGFFVIDADQVARKITSQPQTISLLSAQFGKSILNGEQLNRKALASIVFSNKDELQKMNNILFPLICDEITTMIQASQQNYILLDAPQLFESGLNKICNKIIAAISPMEILIWRITSRDGISQEDAEKRLHSQLSQDFFIENADYVINTYDQNKSAELQAHEIANKIIGPLDVF
jgi:dephospho-CoA kinase